MIPAQQKASSFFHACFKMNVKNNSRNRQCKAAFAPEGYFDRNNPVKKV